MNTKILQLLELLVSNHGCVGFDKICDELDFTKRMLFYYQKKLNEYLKEARLPLAQISEGMLKIEYQDKQQFQKLFAMAGMNGYVLEPQERQDLMLLNIGLGYGPVTLEQLSERLDISRSTALSDIGEIKAYLDGYGIGLLSKPRRGYFLTGDELKIRYVLMACSYSMKNLAITKLKMDLLITESSKRSGRLLDEKIIYLLKELIYTSEKHIEKQFDYFSINDMAESLLLIYLRSFHGNARLDMHELAPHMEQQMAGLILAQMKALGLEMAAAEQSYVQVLLMGARLYGPDSLSGDMQVESFTKELLRCFERLSQIRIPTDTALYQMFRLHVRPMFYRAKYRIKVSNFLDGAIRKVNSSFYYLTRIAVETCSSRYGLDIDDDEITYLSLYFNCIGSSGLVSKGESMPRILIVCGFGLGCCVYVRSQLEKLLGYDYQYDITDIRSLLSAITAETVLVVSTVDLQQLDSHPAVPVITVSTVLTAKQKTELIQWMLQSTFLLEDAYGLGEIMEIISKSAEIMNHERLLSDLRRYFSRESQAGETEIHLEQIFLPEYVSICHDEVDWREAIYIAGMPLIKDSCIYPGYLEDIILGIEEHGPYAECRKGILLAHAKPSLKTQKLSLSAALFKKPLYFESWNKTMDMVFILAVTDYKSHAAALVELIDHLSMLDAPGDLAACKTAEELYHLLQDKAM